MKTKKFHEALVRQEALQLPSERGFAQVMGIAFYVLTALAWWHRQAFAWMEVALFAIGSAFLMIGYTRPLVLRPLNILWAKLGHLLFRVTNPIIMLALYAITIVPMGLLLRVMGKDPLHRKLDKHAASYWMAREIPGPAPETITRQF